VKRLQPACLFSVNSASVGPAGPPQGGISCSQLYKWSGLAAINGLFIYSFKAGYGARPES